MPEKGLLIVVSGPAGCGKGTVLRQLFESREGLFYSVSATTRSPRPGEEDGVHYFFLTKQEFERRIALDDMLEYAAYCENYYGTPRSAVEQRRGEGNDVILEIEVQGAMKVREKVPDAILVFIMPPSLAVLEKRLRGRGTESEEVVLKRMERAKAEISLAPQYDYIVVNGELQKAVDDLSAILTAEKLRSNRFNGGV